VKLGCLPTRLKRLAESLVTKSWNGTSWNGTSDVRSQPSATSEALARQSRSSGVLRKTLVVSELPTTRELFGQHVSNEVVTGYSCRYRQLTSLPRHAAAQLVGEIQHGS
jgi:hypothetical protein